MVGKPCYVPPMVARTRCGTDPDSRRRFGYVDTYDRELLVGAGRRCLQNSRPAPARPAG